MCCEVLETITCRLPQVPADPIKINIESELKLAGVRYHISSEINILIGADNYYDLRLDGIRNLGKNMPVLQKCSPGVGYRWKGASILFKKSEIL